MAQVLVKGPEYRYHDLRPDGRTAACGRAQAGRDGWYVEERSVPHSGRCGHCYNMEISARNRKQHEAEKEQYRLQRSQRKTTRLQRVSSPAGSAEGGVFGLPDPRLQRHFSVLGLVACADGQKVMVGHGAHAEIDDLPPGEAGIQEMAARIARHYGTMYGDPEATWRLLRLWEHNLAGETVGVIEIGDMDKLDEELGRSS